MRRIIFEMIRLAKMKQYRKKNFPVEKVRWYLEPSPTVLVTSAWKRTVNVMPMGWYSVLEFSPSLLGCYIWNHNYSFELIRKSRECVLNLPEAHLLETVIRAGNTSGRTLDKFKTFGLTPRPARRVRAPLIAECFASFECKVVDVHLLKKYNFFILQIVQAHVAPLRRFPRTFSYRGEGVFTLSGKSIAFPKSRFNPDNL